jgi:3-dehydroshikimate dehydratase
MLEIGLTSVSFRGMSAADIVMLCAQEGVNGIEWGGDIHVPHGDLDTAKGVSVITKSAGIKITSYGSYYFVGVSEIEGLRFETVLETAKCLGAPIIRVWAGNKNMDECSEDELEVIIRDSLRISNMAGKENIQIAFEYHENSLTDSIESADRFAKKIKGSNIKFYWQPSEKRSREYNIDSLQHLIKQDLLSNIHVFHSVIKNDCEIQQLLCEGVEDWKEYLDIISNANCEINLLFEFFKDGSIENFLDDKRTLRKLLMKYEHV